MEYVWAMQHHPPKEVRKAQRIIFSVVYNADEKSSLSQGFFSAAGNDNGALDLRIVQRTADEGGQGEMKEFCCALEFHLFSFRHTELDDVRFVVRRVVAVGRAGFRFDIRFVH